MTAHRAINIALATLIAAVLSTSYLLDGPTDHSAEHAQAAALDDSQQQAARSARFERAASKLCGNGAYKLTEAGAVDCINRKTRKGTTLQVEL